MTRHHSLQIAGSAMVAAVGAAILLVKFSGCAMTEEQAFEMVMAELTRAGLDAKYLSVPTSSPGECSVYFEYVGNGRTISYVAAEDILHGPELHRWDYANGP